MYSFTTWKIEAYLSSAWVDLTPDVLVSPSPKVQGMGIQGSSIMDRVGGVGTLTFSLRNSAASSGGVVGYYTPEGVNRRTGWGAGVRVRLYFEYEGFRRYRFYGKIDRDGIEVITGSYNERIVNVKCSNWMKDASTTLLDLAQYKTNIESMSSATTDVASAASVALANMSLAPDLVSYNGASVVFTTAFDNSKSNTTVIGELNKIVFSELGLMYMRGSDRSGENLVFEPRTHRATLYSAYPTGIPIPKATIDCTDKILMEDGSSFFLLEDGTSQFLMEATQAATITDSDIEDMTVHYGDNYYNQVKFVTYPRKVDASPVVLYNIESPIYVPNGGTLNDIRGDYRDPDNPDSKANANNETMIAPVATTDYTAFANEDGTGTDYTTSVSITADYGTADVKYTIVNNAGADVYITFLQARGYGIYFYDTTEKLFNDTAAQSEGIVKLELELPYVNSLSQILIWSSEANIWTELLNGVSSIEMSIPRISFTANKSSKLMMLFMFLEPSWLLNVSETVTTPGAGGQAYYSTPWFIQGYDFEIINGNTVVVNYELKWHDRT